ncbi:MAG: hypothetical protein K0R51_2579 [Cytophagaceae bacterium]|jgi:hypothetical protein|nr:hypothetical protein [Cytophagaceae bacterium]
MQTTASIILHFSILFISVYYYNKVDKVWIKRAVLAFGVYALCAVLKDFLPWKYALTLIALFALPIAAVFTWLEVYKSTSILAKDKKWVQLFLLPGIVSAAYYFFRPLMVLSLPLSLLSIGILLYYTFKYRKSDYLTQELAIMNLFGIEFILRLVKGFYIFYF